MSGFDWSGSAYGALLVGLEASRKPRLVIVSGPTGSGMTIWCVDLAQEARAYGISHAGLISPSVYAGSKKVGLDLFDLSTRERRRLANLRANLPSNYIGRKWDLDEDTLQWGNQILEKIQHIPLLIIDELGPLELVEHKGLTHGIQLLDAQDYQLACVVIRPSLLSTALERWPWAETITADDRECGGLLPRKGAK